jgi:hypothetical protein
MFIVYLINPGFIPELKIWWSLGTKLSSAGAPTSVAPTPVFE